MADTKNLCAQIPIDLHRQVREHQEESGKSLGEYMTWLITTFYQTEVEKQMSSTESRTVAFQVPADLFEQFKVYLDRHHVKQKAFFLDCIQRALAGEMEAQTRLIREQMGSLLGDACRQAGVLPETVGVISVVGNPCIQQLFLGIMPENLAKIPFAPVLTKAEVGEAGDIFPCCPHAALVTVPDISGYVGADTVGCVLASGLDREEKRTLLVDIGTNGEMVLGNRERMIACATAAGPALEGAKIRFGMRGEPGAIDHAALVGNTLSLSVIGGGEAAGICGSGLIDIAAVLLDAGVVNARGRLDEPGTALPLGDRIFETEGQRCFRLTDSVYLTQDDIRQLQMAKGAIASGIELMAAQLGGGVETIERVLLAGAFGSFIRPESACRIGLLPPQLLDRIQAIGNAAGSGWPAPGQNCSGRRPLPTERNFWNWRRCRSSSEPSPKVCGFAHEDGNFMLRVAGKGSPSRHGAQRNLLPPSHSDGQQSRCAEPAAGGYSAGAGRHSGRGPGADGLRHLRRRDGGAAHGKLSADFAPGG